MTTVDELLCNATESQLRNVFVLAMRGRPDMELIELFKKEEKMTAREAQAFAKTSFGRVLEFPKVTATQNY